MINAVTAVDFGVELSTMFPISGAGSDGRRDTSLIIGFHNTFLNEPISWVESIKPKQGSLFAELSFANGFSL